ncbi:MAG: hypothetical protein KGH60_01930 [Candidatus Micrarchaeota archaeon]|nr:hypothetical protein [Candidatus Micrarchaeota archaeon]
MPDDSTREEWAAAMREAGRVLRVQPRYTKAQIFPEEPRDDMHMISMLLEFSRNPPAPANADINSIDWATLQGVGDAYQNFAILLAADAYSDARDKGIKAPDIPEEIASDSRFVSYVTSNDIALRGHRDEKLGLDEDTILDIISTHSVLLGSRTAAPKDRSLSH